MASFKEYSGLILRSFSNIHLSREHKDIFLFATARGGSTWMMEILASQPGFKYYDEPFNIRRTNVQFAGVFREWSETMPDAGRSVDIIRFLQDLQHNRYRSMNPLPFRRHHRFVTNRIVFKIHGLEHLINEIKDACHGSVVFLLRHPIPTTISRYVFPRLDNFVASCHYLKNYLDEAQMKEIRKIYCGGTLLQRGVLSWCYENLIPLRFADNRDWLFVTYEELLLNSTKTCHAIAEHLSLPQIDTMIDTLNTPAANIKMSKQDTLTILEHTNEQKRKYGMVTKWKSKISEVEERSCFEILDLFGLDTYSPNRLIAHDRFLHFPDTKELAGQQP